MLLTRTLRRLTVLTGAAWLAAVPLQAQFVPGNVYVPEVGVEGCPNGPEPNDRIWEINPLTGQSRIFREIPDSRCGGIGGLAFTPDGARLRAGIAGRSTILEATGAATLSIALDQNDGIAAPVGSNCIAYGPNGDFFVVNQGALNIRRFPADGGPSSILADNSDGILTGGPIGVSPAGDVFYGAPHQVLRISPIGITTIFDTISSPGGIRSLAFAPNGDLFVLDQDQFGTVYHYPGAQPASRYVLATGFLSSSYAGISLSPDGESLYVSNSGRLFAIDVTTSELRTLAQVPSLNVPSGIAVYVPEPSCVLCFAFGGIVFATLVQRARA